MIRTALALIGGLKDKRVVGIYFASNTASGVTPMARLLHTTVSTGFHEKEVLIWRFDSSVWSSESSGLNMTWPFRAHRIESEKEVLLHKSVPGFSSDKLNSQITDEEYLSVSDFEDFMNDQRVEWISS
jgi:hypothetical protein